jgi:hypothetical protein
MSKQYPGGIISKTAPVPSGPFENSTAPGIWTLEQQAYWQKLGQWPIPGNTQNFIEDVFSTYLYTGTGYTQTIYNNIQLTSGVSLLPGQALGGGYFGGFISTTADGVATHALIVGPVASAQSATTIQYKNANTATAGADSDIDGPQNTADMVADGNATVYPAAHFCNDLVIGGFSDWYMPAKNELEVCYYTLKPTTAANDTSAGINPNAVPARASNYQPSGPTQPAADNFFIYHTYLENQDLIQSDDIVVIGWSHYNRKSFVLNSENVGQQGVIERSIVYKTKTLKIIRSINPVSGVKHFLNLVPRDRGTPYYDHWSRDYFSEYEPNSK